MPLPHLSKKKALLKAFWKVGLFKRWATYLLAGPFNKPFSAPNSHFGIIWPCCAMGTGTRISKTYQLFFGFFSYIGHYRVLSREFPVLYSRLLLSILYIVLCICQSQSPSLFLFSASHPGNFEIFYICDSYFHFVKKFVFTMFYNSTYMQFHNICPSLSDLFHSVWQSLGPFMLLQIALFLSFL